MIKTTLTVAICSVAAIASQAAENPTTPANYVSASVMEGAGINLAGDGFPGASVETWLAMPAEQVMFLHGDWTDLLGEIHRLGDVSVLSGNETLMHLATGQYDPFRGGEGHALVLNAGIDLRLFPGHWEYGAAVLPASGSAPGFIFFNGAGDPVHRILLTETSNTAEFDALVAEYKAEKPAFAPWSETAEPTEAPTEETKAAFLEAWRGLQDTHEFSGLLSQYKLSRTDALRLAQGEFTEQLDTATYTALFGALVEKEVSIILFALNNGCVQISTGALDEISQAKGTLQLVEHDSRTLMVLPRIKEVWRVSKPTKRGLAHSLELYNDQGEPVAYIFGSAKGDDTTNVDTWKEILFALPANGASAVNVAGAPANAPAASSEVETSTSVETSASTEITAQPAGAATPTVDLFNLPRRVRSQISYTVKRMLEFDQNGDGMLAQDELPARMQGVIAKGNLNGDTFLDNDELTRMAYHQIEARDAQAEAEPTEKR